MFVVVSPAVGTRQTMREANKRGRLRSLSPPSPAPVVPDICQRPAAIKAILRPRGVWFIDWPCFRVRSPANLIDLT